MDKFQFYEFINFEILGKKSNIIIAFFKKSFLFGKNHLYLIRRLQYLNNRKGVISYLFYRIIKTRLIKRYGIFINGNVTIGKGLQMPHPNGIVIGSGVIIGDNCRIYQQVTIGGKNIGDSEKGAMPRIGNNCVLFAGCKILGNIYVADGTIVGANAVLTHSTEANSVYVGLPARKIIKK